MLVLIGIGLAAGFITAISPCVLPVLPIVFAGGATGGRRKPFAIIAGLILSFTAFTLFGVWLLRTLGLPEDLLRNVAIALLFLVAATLLFPKVEEIVQRPFLRLTRRPSGDLGGGLLLGASLGLVFVPCAGPVLATVTVVAARRPRRHDRAQAARASHPAGARRRRRADRARDRVQRRPPLPDGDSRLHAGASEQG
jgi:cytochrome c biogenesis protein CcdA